MAKSFAELYKTYTNHQLVKIIADPSNYQPDAVLAANAELKARNVGADEIVNLKLDIRQQQRNDAAAKEEFNKTVNNGLLKLRDFFLVPGKYTVETLLNRFIIILLIISIYRLYKGWWLLSMLFTDFDIDNIDFYYLLFLFDLVVLPICAYLLYKIKPRGWYFICFYSVFGLIVSIKTTYRLFTIGPIKTVFSNMPEPVLDISAMLFSIIFWAFATYFIIGNNLRQLFNVSPKAMLYTIIISAIIALVFF